MSCVEKRHMSHRMGSMLHHRFPNGFTDLFMDETDREVSTLTDRAFRSLCVGDDAVYNDEFLYGYSPFNCHKPLAGEPLKKTHHKESKKQGQHKNDKTSAQPWKQQHQKSISHMSSFLKALSATEESCEGMLIKNGGITDSKGESWDKSALRSIQRELSEFSTDYHSNLKDDDLPTRKSSKTKNGKATVKLRKLNIKNFFLHSEFSPFQTWRDFNRFPFSQENTVVSTDNIPKWYDMPFYKELTEAHRKEILHTEEAQLCQKVVAEPPPPIAPKPLLPSPPTKVLPKPLATPAEKRCSSDGGDGTSAPWRRNRSRAKSVIPVNQLGIPPEENGSKTVEESLVLGKKEARSVEVRAIEEVSSLASTPFSICQLMTPLIPSRQPTETSEILLGVLSPSALDLPLRPHSEAKQTPEPPVKRDSYKSLASSILFNLKDNRKRVKSRYSPPKFKTLEVPGAGTQSPQLDHLKPPQDGSEGNASGLSTPAILKDGQAVCSPILESNSSLAVGLTKDSSDRPLSDDYLLSNLLQTKREVLGNSSTGEENLMLPVTHLKNIKSPMANKQNYPSLNLYKKTSPVDSDMKYLQGPLSTSALMHKDQQTELNDLSPPMLNREIFPKLQPTNTGLSPKALYTNNKDCSPIVSLHAFVKEGLSSNLPVGKMPQNVPYQAKQPAKDIKEKHVGVQPVSSSVKDTTAQPLCTMDVIRAAREAISAAKYKARSATQSDSTNKPISDIEELREREVDKMVAHSKEMLSGNRESSVPANNNNVSCTNEVSSAILAGQKGNVKKEPPPVPKRNFVQSDIQLNLDQQQKYKTDKVTNGDLTDVKLDSLSNESETVQKQAKVKHVFSARQNNYIKSQRYSVADDEHAVEIKEGDMKVNTRFEMDEDRMSLIEMKDGEHIIHDLHALKELERARLGDYALDDAKNKLGVINIDEEARAKNDLISRELRNIKKGMLSMRGNTLAKKELFANKEKEHNKQQDVFTKIDSNVIVNKALFNDNYDKAKMALEEIISERQKRQINMTGPDAKPKFDRSASDESYAARAQQVKNEDKKKHNGSTLPLKDNDLKERLGDLRDHNHIKQILSQSEPGLGEMHRPGGKKVLPGMDKASNELNMFLKVKAKPVNDTIPENPESEMNQRHTVRQISQESGENLTKQNEDGKGDAPPVPPRGRKTRNRTDTGVTKEADHLKDVAEEDISDKDMSCALHDHNHEVHRSTDVDTELPTKESVNCQHETSSDKERCDVENTAHSELITGIDSVASEVTLPTKCMQSETKSCVEELSKTENEANKLQADVSPALEATFANSKDMSQETYKVKQNAPLKTDLLHTLQTLVSVHPDKISRASEEINVDTEALSEASRDVISPLLLVNGISIDPPDQASSSSKSSYFSVESALHRNVETESNVYHSLENLIGEMEEMEESVEINISQKTKQDSDRMEVEYCPLNDHRCDVEVVKEPINSPPKEKQEQHEDSNERQNASSEQDVPCDENNQTPVSPSNTFSPSLGIPVLFKVKDNTFNNKMKKMTQPWSPRGSLNGTEKGEQELYQVMKNTERPLANEPATSDSPSIPDEVMKPKTCLSNTPPLLPSPSNMPSEMQKKPQFGEFLTVPQQTDDRSSGLSPSSEGAESLTASTADTADELGLTEGAPVMPVVPKVPSEWSGSTCSGNESQPGLPKPPAVLPKSEKAVLKAIKLTNRRMKKEEAQKSSHKSPQRNSKQKVDRHRGDKSEHKGSSSRHSKNSQKNIEREKTKDGHQTSQSHGKKGNDQSEQPHSARRDRNNGKHQSSRTDMDHKTRKQSEESVEGTNQNCDSVPNGAIERQGRSSNRHVRDKPEQRYYSTDRIISNVPVYKAQISERPTSDRTLHRSQSIDRCLGDKVERRLSTDMSVNEKLDPRSQRIEKSIMDELQQRGRTRDKIGRDNPLRRSHSIDAYSTDVPHPSSLSRQSSHTSQLSRQSSIEHTIITQSFPMTQRKLLQDPDSGQYFFVDMPVQVKTKTFFDPETGSYVQLPVQPPEGAVPQVSPLEVLTPPLVVYHGFVPVPLSPMTQKAPIQATQIAPEEFEQRHIERPRQMHCKEKHPYLEPVYAHHDHMLGEFLGTEELDCPS